MPISTVGEPELREVRDWPRVTTHFAERAIAQKDAWGS